MSDKRYLSDLSKLVVDTEDGKRRHYQATLDYLYSNLDVLDWLIEQAEKVEQLQRENEKEQNRLRNQIYETVEEKFLLEKQLQQAQAKIERYEKALNHWNTYFDFSQPVPKDLNELGTQKGVQRCFDIARQALEGEK